MADEANAPVIRALFGMVLLMVISVGYVLYSLSSSFVPKYISIPIGCIPATWLAYTQVLRWFRK
jgi:hypothetical protein